MAASSAQARVDPHLSASQNPRFDLHYYLTMGLGGVEHQGYQSAPLFDLALRRHNWELATGAAGEYVVYSPVTEEDLEDIGRKGDTADKWFRVMYLNTKQVLIVRLAPGTLSLLASSHFDSMFRYLIRKFKFDSYKDVPPLNPVEFMADTSLNQADLGFKPMLFRPRRDLPTLIVQFGYTRFLTRPRVDARWWLENTDGEVKFVLLISFRPRDNAMRIEKWEMVNRPNPRVTHHCPDPIITRPWKTQEIDVFGKAVIGGPLTFDFEKLMLRRPGPGEGDLVFAADDLVRYLACVLSP